jgi:N-acyl-D-aspartate/D-glutamate deacylase
MSKERAVQRLTGEIATWFHLPNGRIAIGQQADLVVVNPDALDTRLDDVQEIEMPGFDGLKRLVRRSVGVVPYVLINGRIAARNGEPVPELGRSTEFGRVLKPE